VVVHLTFFNFTYTVRTAPDITFNRCLQLFVCYYKQNVYILASMSFPFTIRLSSSSTFY
jgi:hypothetical protein